MFTSVHNCSSVVWEHKKYYLHPFESRQVAFYPLEQAKKKEEN